MKIKFEKINNKNENGDCKDMSWAGFMCDFDLYIEEFMDADFVWLIANESIEDSIGHSVWPIIRMIDDHLIEKYKLK